MADITTKIEEVSSIKKKIEVLVPVDRIKKALEAEYKKIGKDAKLKGFRKGKVPHNVLEQYYSSEIEKETMERLVRETYPEALEKEMVVPISAPYVEPGPFDKAKPFSYVATFEIRPVIEIKEYDGLKLEKPEVTVSKEEVDQQLEAIQKQMTQLEPTDDGVKGEKGMVLIVDFMGTADGKPFKGSEANDFMVELGAGNMLPAFEEVLIGACKGDEKDIDLEYPADYFNEDLAGKKGHFHIKVKDIKKKIVPELNDEFAKDLGEFKTMKEVKADIEKRIIEVREQDVKRIISAQVIEQLIEKHPFEVPEAMINSELKSMFESFVRHLVSQGKKFEDTGMKIEEFVDKYKNDAENRVKSFLIIDAIAEVEKVGVADSDVDERVKLIAQQSGEGFAKVKAEYEKQNLVGALKIQLRHEKCIDLIIDKAKVKVKKATKEKKK